MKLGFSAILSLFLGVSAFGTELSLSELQAASKTATELFASKNSGHLQFVTGFKVWKAGDDAKVKVYMNHHGTAMDVEYTCFRAAGAIDCRLD